MAQATGSLSKLVMGYESAFGTIATEGFVMPINSSTLKGSKQQTAPATITGTFNPVEPYDGNWSVGGAVVVPVDSIAFWYWMKAAFNSPTTSGTDPYEHVFDVGTSRPSITIEHQYTDLGTAKYFQYTGCKVSSYSISAGGDGEATATFNIVGANETIASSSFDVSPTTVSLGRLKQSHLTLKEAGSTISNAKMVSLDVNFKCDTSQYVIGGGGTLGAIPDGVMSVTGNIDALFEDTALLEKAINGTESSLELTFTGGLSSILVIDFNELKYSPNSPGIPGPQGIAISLPWSAYYDDDADGSSVVVTLTNGEAHA